ncbi:MAG: hypothetical protein JWO08_2214, partial [Verrucomicrobiaceae bacterium]|nr:hypothetical protein [Verrucomicrobiaceae bacterium]
MAKSSVQTPPKRKASLRVSDAPVVDERFQRADKAKGQDVSISRSIHGDLVLLHRVALDPESSTEVRQSLLQTAQATARFRDPHVLPVREVRLEGDSLVFVQDYPQGPLLSDAMTPGRPMPLVEALTWMRQFAHSLEEAESQGLTLSQIGPADFVVTELLLGAGKRQLISLCPPVPAGWWLEVEDPVYASPEQKVGDVCDIRSSLFSAGAVLAVMLTGHRPERDNDWLPLLAKAALPKLVDQALKRVLNPDPAKRCANPAEWMALLDKAIAASAPTSLPQPVRLASPPALVADPPPVAKQKAKPEPVPEAPPAKQKASPPPAPAAEAPPAKSQAKQVPAPPSTPAKQKAQAKPLPLETQTRVIATRSVPQVPLNVLSRSTFVLRD